MKCEDCGKPAVVGVRDVATFYKNGYLQSSPRGRMHFFCEEHRREPEYIDLTPIFPRPRDED